MTKKIISFFLALAFLTALFVSLSVGVGAAATKEENHRTPDPDDPAFILKLKSSDPLKKESRVIKAAVSTVNNVDVPVSSGNSERIGIQPWVPWAIAGSIIAVIAALTAFIMTRKVLPKKIIFDPDLPAVVLFGAKLIGAPLIWFRGKGNRGQLRVMMPPNCYNVNDDVTLNLVAASPRYVKSSRRKVKIVSINFMTQNETEFELGGCHFVKAPDGHFVIAPGGGAAVVDADESTDLNVSIANGQNFSMTTKINGRWFTIQGTLRFI